MSDLDKLRRRLAVATNVAQMKALHDDVCALSKTVASAKDFELLDECTAVRLACTRKGGALLLAGADRVPGVDAEQWCKRAEMDERDFALVVRRAQAMQRRRAGESPPPQTRGEDSAQSRTLVSPWHRDRHGNLTRFVVGVCARRYKERIRAGGDPDKVEAELIAEVLERAA